MPSQRASPMGLSLFLWDLPLFSLKNGKSRGKSQVQTMCGTCVTDKQFQIEDKRTPWTQNQDQ